VTPRGEHYFRPGSLGKNTTRNNSLRRSILDDLTDDVRSLKTQFLLVDLVRFKSGCLMSFSDASLFPFCRHGSHRFFYAFSRFALVFRPLCFGRHMRNIVMLPLRLFKMEAQRCQLKPSKAPRFVLFLSDLIIFFSIFRTLLSQLILFRSPRGIWDNAKRSWFHKREKAHRNGLFFYGFISPAYAVNKQLHFLLFCTRLLNHIPKFAAIRR
jgi:hypothetical protein